MPPSSLQRATNFVLVPVPRFLFSSTMSLRNGQPSLVAHAEEELSAIGKRMRLQERRDMGKSRSTSSVGRYRDGRGYSASSNAIAKPKRSSLDNVGEREVKVRARLDAWLLAANADAPIVVKSSPS